MIVRRAPVKPLTATLVFFGLCCLAVVLIGKHMESRNAIEKSQHFDSLTTRVVQQLKARIGSYEYGLRGARGAFIVTEIDGITRARFHAYMLSRDLDREFPGARGFGFIRRVAPEQEAAFVAAVRVNDREDFQIKQLTPHNGERLVVQYIEPEAGNSQSIGLDIASEARRREAAETAIRNGEAALTKPITLVQAMGKIRQGFLFFIPVYRWSDPVPPSEELRQQFGVGLVYTPLLIDEVLADFDFRGGEFSVALADGDDSEHPERFYASPGADEAAADGLIKQFRLTFYGRVWLVEVKAQPLFIQNLNQADPWQMAVGMLVMAALLSLILYMWQMTKLRRQQFLLEQARLAAIVANSSDAIIGTSLDGTIISWNKAAELVFGYTAEQACGRLLVDLVVPDDLRDQQAALLNRIIQGETIPHFNTRRRRHGGVLIDASVTVSPIYDGSGQVVGKAETIRDISQQQAEEARIRELNNTLEQQVIQRTAELERARSDLQTVLDAVPTMIGYWDRNLINQFANQAYYNWLGIEAQRIKGMSIREVLGAELYDLNRPYIEAALNGEKQIFERAVPRPDGTGFRYSLTHYLPDWVDGQIRGFYVIAHDVSEIAESRQQLTEALRENELLSHTINEQLLVSITDSTGQICEVNENFCRLSGYSREELLGQNHRMVNSGVHAREFWTSMWKTISAGKAWRAEVCNRAKDGSLYWVDNVIAPVFKQNGEIGRYISVRADITEKKNAEVELARVNGMLASVMQASTRVSIIATDRDGVILLFNSGAERMLGYRADEVIGKMSPAAFHSRIEIDQRGVELSLEYGGRIEGFQVFVHKAELDGFEIREWTYTHKDGSEMPVSLAVTPMRDQAGNINGYLGIAKDISLSKKQQATIRRMLEASPVAVRVALQKNQRVVFVNQRFADLVRCDREQAIGLDIRPYYVDPQDFESIQNRLEHGETVVDQLVQLQIPGRPDYGKAWVLASYMPIDYEGQDAVLAWLYDVSELRNAKTAAEAANLAKSNFLANMSHEIRTPMNAVLALSGILEEDALTNDQRDLVNRIGSAGRSLLAIINDILDFSKIEANQLRIDPHPFSLSGRLAYLDSLIVDLIGEKQLTWHIVLPADIPDQLCGDNQRLEQILTNLLGNAVKFTAQGEVCLTVAIAARDTDTVRLRFEVSDTGIGILPEACERLFTPFTQAEATTTRRYGGTGLGLSICKRLVELMGGAIGVVSQLGQGSVFWFELPFEYANLVEPAVTPLSQMMPRGQRLSGLRILAVDDNEMNLEVIRRLLGREAAKAVLVTDGHQVLAALRAEPQGYDAVLMDMQMPIMDGFAATHAIRNELAMHDLPVIAFSAGVLDQERKAMYSAGVNDFLPKPVDPEQLVECLQRWTGRSVLDAQRVETVQIQSESQPFPVIAGIDSQLAIYQLDGDHGLFLELLVRFVSGYATIAEQIVANLVRGERDMAITELHKLKSQTGYIGAVDVVESIKALEAALLSGQTDVDPLARHFSVAFNALIESVRQWLKENPQDARRSTTSNVQKLDIARLCAMLDQLESLLANNLLSARAANQEIETLLSGSSLAERYQAVTQAVSLLKFQDARLALAGFRESLPSSIESSTHD